MAIRIGQNIASHRAQRKLSDATSSLSTAYERLSSGLRINHASDDAAGLSVASSLSAGSRLYTQAIRNVSDGISMLSISEAGVSQLSSIVGRLQELTTQAANATYSTQQRSAIISEVRPDAE